MKSSSRISSVTSRSTSDLRKPSASPSIKTLKSPKSKGDGSAKATGFAELSEELLPTVEQKVNYEPDYMVPGVVKLVLAPNTQKKLDLVVGDDVTSQKPWKLVPKKQLYKYIRSPMGKDLAMFMEQLDEYTADDVLFGYYVDEMAEDDEFYICLTTESRQQVTDMYERQQAVLEAHLQNCIIKQTRPWMTLGSEEEVDDMNEDQRYRALFEVEVEARFPIQPEADTKFQNRDADDAVDGYVEIIPEEDEEFENVVRLRVDRAVQASLPKTAAAAQTDCTFPVNMWTEYKYEYEVQDEYPVYVKKGAPKPKTRLEKFLGEDRIEPIIDQLNYNSTVDLYKNDYPDLRTSKETLMKSTSYYEESSSFADVDCSEKLIGSCSWSTLKAGLVVIAYVDVTSATFLRSKQHRDQIYRAVHGVNPVLIWHNSDTLRAKLELESPREVTAVAFCPFDPNIVIGGCANGQIILWDITDRVNEKLNPEVLTVAQQKYRTTMLRMTSWFKSTKNERLVRPACLSNLGYGHQKKVVEIRWVTPQVAFKRNGRCEHIENCETNPSYQILTAGEDGFIFIWDLKAIPVDAEVPYSSKISKRLGKRLQALNVDVSPYSVLNRRLKPFYQIEVDLDPKKRLPSSLTCISFVKPILKYHQIGNDFEPHILPIQHLPKLEVFCSFTSGDVATASWEGLDFDTGAEINCELAKVVVYNKCHDGPAHGVYRSPFFDDIILSTGGKVLAVWKAGFTAWPILMRRRLKRITCCSWTIFRAGCFHICLEDGTLEVWDVRNRADQPSLSQSISGKSLTLIEVHRIPSVENMLGIGDYRGTFRLFHIPPYYRHSTTEHSNSTRIIWDSSHERRRLFLEWQNRWKERNLAKILAAEEEKEYQQKMLEIDQIEAQKKSEALQEQLDEEARKKAIFDSKPQPGKYSEWADKKFDEMQAQNMHNLLLKRKHLRREDLVSFLAPLNRIAEEKRMKAIKQEKKIKHKAKIFLDTISIAFPEIITGSFEAQMDKSETNVVHRLETDPGATIGDYVKLEEETLTDITATDLDLPFCWPDSISRGLERRKIIDIGLVLNTEHRSRIKNANDKLSESNFFMEPLSKSSSDLKVIEAEQAEHLSLASVSGFISASSIKIQESSSLE